MRDPMSGVAEYGTALGEPIQPVAAPIAPAMLGECPVWDSLGHALYFIDCRAPSLRRYDPATTATREWKLPSTIGSFALDLSGGAILALASGLAHLDLASGALTSIAHPEADRPDHRFNDGAADSNGRFWVGSMHSSYREPSGTLWCLESNAAPRAVFSGLRVPNGLAWSPDGRRFYFNDSPRAMFVADFDGRSGAAGPPWVFAAADAAPGWPDGSAIDCEGYLWNARWDGGGIARFAPDGRLDRFIALPVSRPTSCAFGGRTLSQLYVTSARIGIDPATLAREPLAGAVFCFDTGIKGAGQPRYAGAIEPRKTD